MIKISYWDNKKFETPEIEIVVLDFEGTPIFLKIPNWEEIKSFTFTNSQGKEFTGDYINTSEGWLRIDSSRLAKQLFQLKEFKGEISIQRWCDGNDFRSTIYKVEKMKPVTSTKKPTPKKQTTK